MIVLLAVALSVAPMLSACGKKGAPKHPEGSSFPDFYPNPKTTRQGSTSVPALRQEPPSPEVSPAPVEDEIEEGEFFFPRTTTRTFSSE